jgi:hypothetical protein
MRALAVDGLGYPEGDIGDLEAWLADRFPVDPKTYQALPLEQIIEDERLHRGYTLLRLLHEARELIEWLPGGEIRLTDLYGNRLVYYHPSRREGREFDLYSVGPDGQDDGGNAGDDIQPLIPSK